MRLFGGGESRGVHQEVVIICYQFSRDRVEAGGAKCFPGSVSIVVSRGADHRPKTLIMKFTIDRQTLVKMLKVLSSGRVKQNAQLRIAAQDGRVTLTAEDLNEAAYDADVTDEGVCFFRHKQLLPLLLAYKGAEDLTMEITADGINIASTHISRGLWEISLFVNPSLAPQRLILKRPEDPDQMTFDDCLENGSYGRRIQNQGRPNRQ